MNKQYALVALLSISFLHSSSPEEKKQNEAKIATITKKMQEIMESAQVGLPCYGGEEIMFIELDERLRKGGYYELEDKKELLLAKMKND